MQCPNCEAENRDDAKFCDECGFPLPGAKGRSAAASEGETSRPPRSEAGHVSGEGASAEASAPVPTPSFIDDDVFSDFEFDAVAESDALVGEGRAESSVSTGSDVTGVLAADGKGAESDDIDTTADDSDGKPVHEGQAEVRAWRSDDPFAGFAEQVSDDGFDFFADDISPDGSFTSAGGQVSDHTMKMPRVGGAPAQASKDFRISTASRKRPPKVALAVIAVAAVAVIAAVVTFALGLWGGTAIPDVTGMTESDARSVLEESGFSVRSTQVKSDDTEGLVLIMDPAGGSRAAEGSEVVIHIATTRFVPDIVGKTSEEAAAMLGEAGYENVRYDKVKSEEEENIVRSVSPEAGTRAKSSMEIVVEVTEAYRVPDISSLDLTAAQEAIAEAGLTPQVIYVDTQEYAEGTILGTTPEANTKVSEGDYVSVNVARARGAELVALTEGLLSPGGTATIGGTSIAVDSVDSVSYLGDGTVAFTITGRPYATLMGETVYGTAQSVEGQVVWSDDNEVISIS